MKFKLIKSPNYDAEIGFADSLIKTDLGANIEIESTGSEECEQLTALILNAPEMLEALKRVYRDIQMYCTDNPYMKDSYSIINETIKKATEL